jgi:16S rRNA (guanine527-N7)-methyltransferase
VSGGAAALERAAAALGVGLGADQIGALLAYRDLLVRWNSTYNLTAVRDGEAMLVQHLVDCLAVLPALQRERAGGGRLLDVGSGGGLPGVVVAIALPAWRVQCVDAVAKKAAFVRQVGAELGLSNLASTHGRIETLPPANADVIASRAFAALADFCSLTQRHLAEGGLWMAMKGRSPGEEVAALPPAVDVFHVEPLTVPGLDAERCIVWMRPAAATGAGAAGA